MRSCIFRDNKEICRGTEIKMIKTYRFGIYPSKEWMRSPESMLNLSCELYNAMFMARYPRRICKYECYEFDAVKIPLYPFMEMIINHAFFSACQTGKL
jgi:hypothetical protein